MRTYLNLALLAVLAGVSLAVYFDWTHDRRSGPLLSDLRTLPIESQGQAGTGATCWASKRACNRPTIRAANGCS